MYYCMKSLVGIPFQDFFRIIKFASNEFIVYEFLRLSIIALIAIFDSYTEERGFQSEVNVVLPAKENCLAIF